jgi:hypothetical protein
MLALPQLAARCTCHAVRCIATALRDGCVHYRPRNRWRCLDVHRSRCPSMSGVSCWRYSTARALPTVHRRPSAPNCSTRAVMPRRCARCIACCKAALPCANAAINCAIRSTPGGTVGRWAETGPCARSDSMRDLMLPPLLGPEVVRMVAKAQSACQDARAGVPSLPCCPSRTARPKAAWRERTQRAAAGTRRHLCGGRSAPVPCASGSQLYTCVRKRRVGRSRSGRCRSACRAPLPAASTWYPKLRADIDVILICFRLYVTCPLSYRHIEEPMQDRSVAVDQSTIDR